MFKIKSFGILIICLIFFYYLSQIATAAKPVVIKHENIKLPNWQQGNVKIALLSDFHAGSPFITMKKIDKIVELTNKEKPDIIVLLGDYLNEFTIGGRYIRPEIVAASLSKLTAKYGVYAILGNHDWGDAICRLKNKHKSLSFLTEENSPQDGEILLKAFEKSGIHVLENKANKISINDGYLWLAGISDFKTRNPDLNMVRNLKEEKNPVILLTHSPELFPEIPDFITLVLAGHTHGGQFKIPFGQSYYFSSQTGKIYKTGLASIKNHLLYVTSGIGTSTLPIRFNRPEVVILTLTSK